MRIGVIGAGHLGESHLKILKQIPSAELVGFYDQDTRKSKLISSSLNIPHFNSMESLLDEVSAVNVVVPTSHHHEVASEAITRGIHTFIEKPISQTLDEARDLIFRANKNNVKLQIGHVERFNPAYRSMRQIQLDPKFIEADRLAEFKPRGLDVAVVLDLMIHDLDIILSIVSSEIMNIDASGVAVLSSTIDIANARIKFANGCVANITASRISRKKMRKIRIFQPNSYISMDFLHMNSEVFTLRDGEGGSENSGTLLSRVKMGKVDKFIYYWSPEINERNPLKAELASFIDSIILDTPVEVSGEEGLKALLVALKIIDIIEGE